MKINYILRVKRVARLIQGVGRQRQDNLCEYKAILVYVVPGQPGLYSETLNLQKKKKLNLEKVSCLKLPNNQ